MKIKGRNLGEKEVEYKLLSQYSWFEDRRQEFVKKLEIIYSKYREEAAKSKINQFPKCDNKVVLNPGMIIHRCPNSLESLKAISQYGILASEWFGEKESAQEGVFCAFVSRINAEDNPVEEIRRLQKVENLRSRKGRGDATLFFDGENPIMKKLLHLDYFEYEKIKSENPEKLIEIYSQDEIELFDNIIEPFSSRGKNFHTVDAYGPYLRCDWSAIPGGIPSELVNGICLRNQSYSKEEVDEIAKAFPNATIFNGELEILYEPIKIQNNIIGNEKNVRDVHIQSSSQEIFNIQNMERNIHIGNSGEMHRYIDDTGKRYLIKPAYRKNSKELEPFRAYVQQVGYEIQKLIDPDSAVPCNVGKIKLDAKTILASIQEEIEGTNFTEIPGLLSDKLQQYAEQFLREFVTDYLLGNYDSHIENFIVDERGILRGIDKEQSLKYILDVKTDRININFKPNGAGHEPVYNRLFKLYELGKIDLNLNLIEQYISRIEQIPDNVYIQMFENYVNSVTEDINIRKEMFNRILQRKNNARENIEQFIDEIEINKKEKHENIEDSFSQDMLFTEQEIGKSTVNITITQKDASKRKIQKDEMELSEIQNATQQE